MVKLNRITTGTGDGGTSGLVDGSRLPKDHPRFAAIGEVDELNSAIGFAILVADGAAGFLLARIQNDLFDLGADLATPGEMDGALRIVPAQVDWLDGTIDTANEPLAALTSFVLPGGSEAAARLHLARAICRRAERALVTLDGSEGAGTPRMHYLNKLSDLLFILARRANRDGADDVLWVPGGNR